MQSKTNSIVNWIGAKLKTASNNTHNVDGIVVVDVVIVADVINQRAGRFLDASDLSEPRPFRNGLAECHLSLGDVGRYPHDHRHALFIAHMARRAVAGDFLPPRLDFVVRYWKRT